MTDGKRKGIIFDIQRWSLHDGPGIRTNVFFKGCPLSCMWCSNPESQEACRELAFFRDKCIHCHSCIPACPYGAVCPSEDGIDIDYRKCRSHCYCDADPGKSFRCTKTCYAQALEVMGKAMSIDEIIDEVMSDEGIYKSSGGGITITGGEPLAQPEFLLDLLADAKEKGLHTVMESSMFAEWEKLRKCLPFLDFLFMDLKVLEEGRHLRYTKTANDLILENIKRTAAYALEHPVELVVRTPVIPGVNDTPADIAGIAGWIRKNLPGVERYQLLPYHRLGRGKYRNIGKEYRMEDLEPPLKETMEGLEAEILKQGLRRE